jgi:CBS domain-containing protein
MPSLHPLRVALAGLSLDRSVGFLSSLNIHFTGKMIKKHVRRIPVLDGDKAVGIVYISDLFYHIVERLES